MAIRVLTENESDTVAAGRRQETFGDATDALDWMAAGTGALAAIPTPATIPLALAALGMATTSYYLKRWERDARADAVFYDQAYSATGGCVQVDSLLPDGKIAGEIVVGSAMLLADEKTFEPKVGVVSFSMRKKAPGFRIVTEGGATLVCSDTAPIPTPDGLVLAPAVEGKFVAVRSDSVGLTRTFWDKVIRVEQVGEIDIQHITVGDQSFWAGEKSGSYILHHNIKDSNTYFLPDGSVYFQGMDVTSVF